MQNIEDIPFMTVATLSEKVKEQFPIPDLMSEIATMENIEAAFDYVVGHLECPNQRDHIRPKKAAYCKRLFKLLKSGQFRINDDDFRELEVVDGPKRRIVQCPTVFHRIGCHSIMEPFEAHTYQSLITNTAASIKGRGMHWLHGILEDDLLADPKHMLMFYQCDIYHFYDSISQEIMKEQVRRYTSDPVLLPMLDNFITLLPEGLSKGLRASQCLANLHLNDVDHKMCAKVRYHEISDPKSESRKGVSVSGTGFIGVNGKKIRFHYYRYCDDIVIFGKNATELWLLRDYLVGLLAELGLQVKSTEAVRPTAIGVDYLGYNTFLTIDKKKDGECEYGTYSRIRKRTKKKFARRIGRVKSRKRRQSLIGSFFGMAAHADCRHLLKKLVTPLEYKKLKHKRRMKDFGQMEIGPIMLDGKKNFKGNKVSPRDLNNQAFIVVNFERIEPKRERLEYERKVEDARMRGLSTEGIPKPKFKYLVQIIHNDSLRKFWTGDKELWAILDQIEEEGELPFAVAIEMDYNTQYPKANFVPASKYGFKIPSKEELEVMEKRFNVKLINDNM